MLKIAKDLFDLLYPVGTYYETSNANWTPSSAGWYGTWVEDTAGRITVSKSTDTEFNSIGKTGGSKYLQQHYHDVRWGSPDGSGITISCKGSGDPCLNIGGWSWEYNTVQSDIYTTSNLRTNREGTGDSGNLQPYIVVRRWHRTE